MSSSSVSPGFLERSVLTRRQLYAILGLSALAMSPFLIWPPLTKLLLATDFLPHLYCYLRNPGLVWTHVVADSFIGIAYFAISITLAYLVYKARRDIPFHWMFLAFGLFIVACGGTHFMEVVTIWIPVYILSAVVKVFTAAVTAHHSRGASFQRSAHPRARATGEDIGGSDGQAARQRGTEKRLYCGKFITG